MTLPKCWNVTTTSGLKREPEKGERAAGSLRRAELEIGRVGVRHRTAKEEQLPGLVASRDKIGGDQARYLLCAGVFVLRLRQQDAPRAIDHRDIAGRSCVSRARSK